MQEINSENLHTSVLLAESLEFLNPKRGEIFVDATLGLGGHTEAILLKGANKARQVGTPFMQSLRQAVGLRGLSGLQKTIKVESKFVKSTLVSFKQYRETDGLFYFKLVDPSANTLLQSRGFVTPKEAGAAIAKIKNEGIQLAEQTPVYLGTLNVDELDVINTALQQFVEN